MTPSQTQALQEVKDEVAEKHGYKSWEELSLIAFTEWHLQGRKFTRERFLEFENEAMQLYHTRLLAEAGKDVKFLRDEFYKENTRLESDGKIVEFKHMPHYVFQWFEEKVSALLAAKQAEAHTLKEDLVYEKRGNHNKENRIEELKSQIHDFKDEMFGFIEWMRQQGWEPYQEGWSQDNGVTQIEASELFKRYKSN